MYVVAVGGPFEGIVLYGPFTERNEAIEWADNTGNINSAYEWRIISLVPVDEPQYSIKV